MTTELRGLAQMRTRWQPTSTTNLSIIPFDVTIQNRGSTSQISLNLDNPGLDSSVGGTMVTGTVDTNSDQTLSVTVEMCSISDTAFLEYYSLEIVD